MDFEVYYQKRAFLLTGHGVNWRQHPRNCRIGKTKTYTNDARMQVEHNKMVFTTEDLVLIKVLRQEKGYDNIDE